jgi:hypothetical protein
MEQKAQLTPSILLKIVNKYRVRLDGEWWFYRRRRGLWPSARLITLKLENGTLCYHNRNRRIVISTQTLARDYEPANQDRYEMRARALNLLPIQVS